MVFETMKMCHTIAMGRRMMEPDRAVAALIVGLAFLSSLLAVLRYIAIQDYIISAPVFCNPVTHFCFPGDGEYTPATFAQWSSSAALAPRCNPWSGTCVPVACDVNFTECSVEYCTPKKDPSCLGPSSFDTQ